MFILRSFIAWILLTSAVLAADAVTLKNDRWQVEVDPSTLRVNAKTNAGRSISISGPAEAVEAIDLDHTPTSLHFRRGVTAVMIELTDAKIQVNFVTNEPGKLTWPIVGSTAAAAAKALILPTYEGAYAPTDDADWREFLVKQSPMDTTSGLIMPFWGVDLGGATLTYIIGNPFNNELSFAKDSGMQLTHEFTPNQTHKEFAVSVELTDASPIAPAKAYRQYLIDRGEFVTMRKKIEQTPRAARLLGAAQVYVWGNSLLSRYDVRDWKSFAKQLESKSDLVGKFSEEAQKQVHELGRDEWPNDYSKSVVVEALCEQFQDAAALTAAFEANTFTDPATWGDGVSTKMLDQLHAAGLDRLCITTGDLNSAANKPQVAARADQLGYLFGPYDSYDSVHRPGQADTWETAQFDQNLYDTGPIIRRDGTKRAGFKQRGFTLSALAARPYVEKRINDLAAKVPFSSWFVDCDAFGEVFDDYSPLHPATQADDAKTRCDRLRWIAASHNVVVGSEGGTAFAAQAIHFAHGMMTPVIGWGDPDLTSRDSRYYLGAYYPPAGPAVFVKQVPLKPYYQKFFYDPRFRLPLYETVFHDSVIATHHWSAASLKFADQVQTVSLLEGLYNVPPLYHLNLAEFKKHAERIKAQYAFFSPLHRELATEPLDEFEFVSDDRQVQRTKFADRAELIANFSDKPFDYHGQSIAPRSILARWLDGSDAQLYSPRP